jgi:hypothetical protein
MSVYVGYRGSDTAEIIQYTKEKLNNIPPVGCDLKVGDLVRYTNPQGCTMDLKIIGFCESTVLPERVVYLNWDCFWFPVDPENLIVLNKLGVE